MSRYACRLARIESVTPQRDEYEHMSEDQLRAALAMTLEEIRAEFRKSGWPPEEIEAEINQILTPYLEYSA